MAMLAEPRRRKRYNLVPRGKALYEDDGRFGTKMLERMGWSKGKGLGANEDGSVEFVRVRYKNDADGLGYEARDDQWTAHENDFNGLLKALNGEEDVRDGNVDAESADETMPTVGFGFKVDAPKLVKKEKLKEKISGESLEEKSKRSKARVHYKKFTRGKDLSRYSEKDLANIFGKKETEETEQPHAIYEQFNASKVVEEQKNDETVNGMQIICTSHLSVADYFKEKMEARKKKLKITKETIDESEPLIKCDEENDTYNEEAKKKSKKSKRALEQNADETPSPDEPKPKKKKKAKNELDEEQPEILPLEEVQQNEPKKKKKERQQQIELETKEDTTLDLSEITESNEKKKKKKNKVITINSVKEAETNVDVEETNAKLSKKKKHKQEPENLAPLVSADEIQMPSSNLVTIDSTEHNVLSSKRKKKQKQCSDDASNETKIELTGDLKQTRTSKKVVPIEEGDNIPQTQDVSLNSDSSSDDCSSRRKKEEEEILSFDQMLAKRNSFDVYTISSFCAEKFRSFDFNLFDGSTLAHISGYSLDDNIQLDVKEMKNDHQRIIQLWNNQDTKYTHVNHYRKYLREARKMKIKNMPKATVKSLKRRSAFASF